VLCANGLRVRNVRALKNSLQITCSIAQLRGEGISMVDAVVKVPTFLWL
jgi:hypothetical protein